jgi:hypothetical protein
VDKSSTVPAQPQWVHFADPVSRPRGGQIAASRRTPCRPLARPRSVDNLIEASELQRRGGRSPTGVTSAAPARRDAQRWRPTATSIASCRACRSRSRAWVQRIAGRLLRLSCCKKPGAQDAQQGRAAVIIDAPTVGWHGRFMAIGAPASPAIEERVRFARRRPI